MYIYVFMYILVWFCACKDENYKPSEATQASTNGSWAMAFGAWIKHDTNIYVHVYIHRYIYVYLNCM